MRKPNESLDDYVVKAPESPAEPPRPVSLRLTGEVEVLKPLARWERPAKLVRAVEEPYLPSARQRLSWFHRSLAVSGALAMATLILGSAIFIGVSDQPAEDIVAVAENSAEAADPGSDRRIMPSDEPLDSNIFTSPGSGSDAGGVQRTGIRVIRANSTRLKRQASTRPILRRAAARPRRPSANPLHFVSRFVPTTLVIYVEDGLVRSRTEPWLFGDPK
jgi:hypothetical protein